MLRTAAWPMEGTWPMVCGDLAMPKPTGPLLTCVQHNCDEVIRQYQLRRLQVYKLLTPHFVYTLRMNANARTTLINQPQKTTGILEVKPSPTSPTACASRPQSSVPHPCQQPTQHINSGSRRTVVTVRWRHGSTAQLM